MEEEWSPIFTARVDNAWKIWLPRVVREYLKLDKGCIVEVKIRVVERKSVSRGEL